MFLLPHLCILGWGFGLQDSRAEGLVTLCHHKAPAKLRLRQAQIDPKTADIASMKTQTRAMEDELNDYKRTLVNFESQGLSCGGKISRRFLDGSWGKNKQLAGSLWKMIHWRVIESQWLPDAAKLVKDVFVAQLQHLESCWSFGKMSGSHFWRTISKHHFAELWVT